MDDPFDLLRGHVRRQADLAEPGTSTDELIAHITLEYHRGHPWSTPGPEAGRRRRRWSSIALTAAVFAGLGAGAVVTAAVLERHAVDDPRVGIVCRASADLGASAVVLPPSDQPINACGQLWRSGDLPEAGSAGGDAPTLVACVGRYGALEVFPGDSEQVCTDLGLAIADVEAVVSDATIELQARIASDIHARCVPPAQAAQMAVALLDELGFEGWDVVLEASDGCGLVVFGEGRDHTLYVRQRPSL